MTCVVGLKTDKGVWIGGDSGGFAGWDHTSRLDTKVFHNGPYMIGFTASYRMGQILRYATLPTPRDGHQESGDSMHRFMCVEFIPAVRGALREGGWLEKDKERESGGQFLVGVAGHLYIIGSDMQVGESRDGFDAVGCGCAYALGAMSAVSMSGAVMAPEDCVRLALQVAERHSGGVRGPFVVLNQPAKVG